MSKFAKGDLITFKEFGGREGRAVINEIGNVVKGVELSPDNFPEIGRNRNDFIKMEGKKMVFESEKLFFMGEKKMLFKTSFKSSAQKEIIKIVNHFKYNYNGKS